MSRSTKYKALCRGFIWRWTTSTRQMKPNIQFTLFIHFTSQWSENEFQIRIHSNGEFSEWWIQWMGGESSELGIKWRFMRSFVVTKWIKRMANQVNLVKGIVNGNSGNLANQVNLVKGIVNGNSGNSFQFTSHFAKLGFICLVLYLHIWRLEGRIID